MNKLEGQKQPHSLIPLHSPLLSPILSYPILSLPGPRLPLQLILHIINRNSYVAYSMPRPTRPWVIKLRHDPPMPMADL